jgi:hypothetical protein
MTFATPRALAAAPNRVRRRRRRDLHTVPRAALASPPEPYRRENTVRRVSAILAVATALLLLATGPSFAAPGSSINLVLLSSAAATTGSSGPHFGDQITFTISTMATDKPWVNVTCYQNGVYVYGNWSRFYDDPMYPWSRYFVLGPTYAWQGGAADCTARLAMWTAGGKERTLAATSFHVAA